MPVKTLPVKTVGLIGALALLALALGYFLGGQSFQPPAATITQIELPDIEKKLRHGEEWLGKVVVVNHWATWCPPCRDEIPLLIEYQRRYGERGVQIVGIAHDMLDAARAFSDAIGINYPSLVAIVGGSEIMQQHGNAPGGPLPFTAFFDRNGTLISTQLGQLSQQTLNQAIAPLL